MDDNLLEHGYPSTPRVRSARSGARRVTRASSEEAVVIERARGGDHDAFRALVETHQTRALGLARRILRDDDAARDAVQDAFLKAYNNLSRFEGRSSFYTWLYRLVVNQCLDRKRRDKAERLVAWPEGEFEPAPALGAPSCSGTLVHPSTAVMRSQTRRILSDAIGKLGDEARRTLLMREVDGLSYAEIAESLDVPVGTVMSRLHYARRRIRTLLEEASIADLV